MPQNRQTTSPGQVARERAIVSGATSGIGRAVAVRLAGRGAVVAVLGRNATAAKDVASEVTAAGGIPFIAPTDVTDSGQVETSVSRFVAEYGGIETVVSAAGIALAGTATDTPLSDWDRILATNLNGSFYLARFTIPELIKTRGTFTAISSDAGVQAACGFAAYCTSKHALQGLVKCLALDYGRYGVRCNAVCPGFVETPMAEQLLRDLSPSEVAYYKAIVPLGRFAQPDEVAAAVAHLSSSDASYVNGLMYRLDGGSTAGYYLAASQ
jgi:meso-butanediol dehydrogenase / (S,S)-butanediol dehydrogenase / diacetyl reductase